jgi:hypothetical protein
MADKNPVRGMQPMDDYEEMMYRRSPEGKAEMQRGAMKAIGVPGAMIMGGMAGIHALDKRNADKKARAAAEKEKSGIALDVENAKKDELVRKEREAYDRGEKTRLRDQGGMKKGGAVKSASSRADGIAQRGKTKGRMV